MQLSRPTVIAFILIALCLLALNVVLLKQNRDLKNEKTNRLATPELAVGTQLSVLRGRNLNGNQEEISFGNDKRKSVLLILSPECSFCEKNLPIWKQIINGIDQSLFRVTVVSLSSHNLEKSLSQLQLDAGSVLTDVDPQDRQTYYFSSVPQTILVGTDGKVERVWTGLLYGDSLREVHENLRVTPKTQ